MTDHRDTTQPIPADAPAYVREMQRKIDEALKGRDRAAVVRRIQRAIEEQHRHA